MFDQLFRCSRTAEFHLAGPLAEPRLRYLRHCAEQGAARRTLRRLAQYMLVIIAQMDLQPDGEIRVEEIDQAARRWAFRQPQHHRMRDPKTAKERFISIATKWLRFLGRLHILEVTPSHYAHWIEQFAVY